MQRIEHYEIAAYGTNIAIARALGQKEAVGLLSETLEEEKQTDLKLTEVTEQHIMAAALEGGGESGPRGRRPIKGGIVERERGHAGCKVFAASGTVKGVGGSSLY